MTEQTRPVEVCPQCGATLVTTPGFSAWCERCGWNIQPLQRLRSDDPFDTLDAEMEQQYAQDALKLAENRLNQPAAFSVPVWASVIALLTHALTAALFVGGLRVLGGLFFTTGINVFGFVISLVFGLGLIVLAVGVQPIFTPRKQGERHTSTSAGLQSLVVDVATAMNVPAPHEIVIDESFDAQVVRTNFITRPTVRLGYLLLQLLTPQETVAAVAIAVACSSSADPRTGIWIGGAIQTLLRWLDIFGAADIGSQRVAVRAGISTVIVTKRENIDPIGSGIDKLIGRIGILPMAALRALYRDTWSATQASRYQGDLAAARVCGTAALTHLFAVMRLKNAATAILQRQTLRQHAAAKGNAPRETLITHMREALQPLPEKEMQRIDRAMRLEAAMSSDDPPMSWRLNLLEAHPALPSVVLDATAHARILAELKPLEVAISRQLFEQYR